MSQTSPPAPPTLAIIIQRGIIVSTSILNVAKCGQTRRPMKTLRGHVAAAANPG